ncbi:MAG: hypothetical protein JOZ18_03420, partial [Chloroflexi bacterium]|nr:hypothetical protein [Chloroflexota bacterium]
MERLENLSPLEHDLLTPFDGNLTSSVEGIRLHMQVQRNDVVARVLKDLWQELELEGQPLIFTMPAHVWSHPEHHPWVLDQLVARGARRKRARFGQLASWEPLAVPSAAHGIAAVNMSWSLLKSDMLGHARISDRGTTPLAPFGWLR